MSVGIQAIAVVVAECVCAREGDAAGASAFRAIPQTVIQVRAHPIVIPSHQVVDRDGAGSGDIQPILLAIIQSIVITDEIVGTSEGNRSGGVVQSPLNEYSGTRCRQCCCSQ